MGVLHKIFSLQNWNKSLRLLNRGMGQYRGISIKLYTNDGAFVLLIYYKKTGLAQLGNLYGKYMDLRRAGKIPSLLCRFAQIFKRR
ncbi:MAG TPA: hypothetical protein VGC22_00335 [Chitinophaga sp.]